MNTKDIAKRVAAAHNQKAVQAAIGQTQTRPTKTAASDRNFFSMVDKDGWKKIRRALSKDGDEASVKLWDESARKIAKELEMPSSFDVALTRMMNLVERGPRDPDMTRNQVFKIADLLGIKMPHGIFASTDKEAGKHKVGLPPYGGWTKFVNVTQLRARQYHQDRAAEDIKHAMSEVRGYAAYSSEDARNKKALYASLIDAQAIVWEQRKLNEEFDKQMAEVHAALKKTNQI
jgi:hypothetical protein